MVIMREMLVFACHSSIPQEPYLSWVRLLLTDMTCPEYWMAIPDTPCPHPACMGTVLICAQSSGLGLCLLDESFTDAAQARTVVTVLPEIL